MTIRITSREDLLKLLVNGRLTQPAYIPDNYVFCDLDAVTSLKGLTMSDNCRLYGLTSITNLEGLVMSNNCRLYDLGSAINLTGVTMGDNCRLYGLPTNLKIEANPTDTELDILKKIPINRLYMNQWHCGTQHCLAGWAQVLSGMEENRSTAFSDGQRILPSMYPYFFAPQEPVIKFLEEIQSGAEIK